MKIAICDDNPAERSALKRRLDAMGELTGAEYRFFSDGEELICEYEKGERYDLVFLDVEMGRVDGINAGNYISSVDGGAMIIFVTSYPQYAIEAFDCNAFHYLLKSSDDDRFNSVIRRALQHYKKDHRFYTLATKDGMVRLPLSDIYYVECFRKHLYFYTADATYVTKSTLKDAIAALQPFDFYQVHQGYVVNFEKVVQIIGGEMILDNGMRVSISVRKHTDVIHAYSRFIERTI